MLVHSDITLSSPPLEKFLLNERFGEVPLKKSFHYKCDSDDCSINSDYTADTTTSTISNDSFDIEIKESQDYSISENIDDKKLKNLERISEIEALALMFESGDFSANSICTKDEAKLLSIEGLNNTCTLLQNTVFEVVHSSYFLFDVIRSNGKILGSSKNNKSCPQEMEIQFVYIVIDDNGKKRIVKSQKKLDFPPFHQMPGCCLKDKMIGINGKKTDSTIEVSNVSSGNPNCIVGKTSTKKSAYSSFLKTLCHICAKVPLTLFQKRSHCEGKSSVLKDDDMLRAEEMEIQFVDC